MRRKSENAVLSLEEMQNIVGRFTYKPAVKLKLETHLGYESLTIMWEAPSARTAPTDTVTVRVNIPIFPRPANAREFKKFIRRVVIGAELHEMDEWLRYDGELIFDPHADRVRDGRVATLRRRIDIRPTRRPGTPGNAL